MVKHVNSVSYETEDIKQLDPSVQDAAIERLKEVITREVKKSLQKELLRGTKTVYIEKRGKNIKISFLPIFHSVLLYISPKLF